MKKIFLILFAIIVLVFMISAIVYTPEFIIRNIRYGESDTNDYLIFDSVAIKKSTTPFIYSLDLDNSIGELSIEYLSNNKPVSHNLSTILAENNTTSFIIIKDGNIVFEEYYNGYSRESINTSFSSVKSIVSLMVGIAIDKGYIQSVDQKISDYIPEIKDKQVGEVTIEELLSMRSNISYYEGFLYFSDDSKTYYYPDLRKLAIDFTKVNNSYDGRFHYNNYHPLLLGIILERSTDMSVSEFFGKMIWEKVGAEYDAFWSVDSSETKFEKMESGLNFRSIDYAKIGSMLINQGSFNGNIIVSNQWIQQSTIADYPFDESEYESSFLEGHNTGYKYMWYSTPNGEDMDYFAAGKYGQYLYISPSNNIVIVRTGTSEGDVDWWIDIFRNITAKLQ